MLGKLLSAGLFPSQGGGMPPTLQWEKRTAQQMIIFQLTA